MKKIILTFLALTLCCAVGASTQRVASDDSILTKPDESLPFDQYKAAALQYVDEYIALVDVYANAIAHKAAAYDAISQSVIEDARAMIAISRSKISDETRESRKTLIGDCMSNVETLYVLTTAKLIACTEMEAHVQDAITAGMDTTGLSAACQDELSHFRSCTTDISIYAQALLSKLDEAIAPFRAQKAQAAVLGALATKQAGPAVKVTDKDDKAVILYAPKKVEYIKVNEK